MTEKRFLIDNESDIIEFDDDTNEYIQDFMWADGKSWDRICNRLNELFDEVEQLKQDNIDLIMVLKNQSFIIQELHSKLLEYELKERKESIVLTKEDLEIMGKAISYYTHGRCGE